MNPNSYILISQFYMLHPWLADLAAPIGSQEVVDHTHKLWQLVQQYLPVCRLTHIPKSVQVGDPTCTQSTVNQSAVTICGCGQQLPVILPVHPSLLTRVVLQVKKCELRDCKGQLGLLAKPSIHFGLATNVALLALTMVRLCFDPHP